MKGTRKWIRFLLAACLVLCMVPLKAQAATVIDSGTCGANATWVFTDDGTLTISGEGDMRDYMNSGDLPWNNYRCWDIYTVNIEEGITSIGSGAFFGFNMLTHVTIPNSVTTIKSLAISHNPSLTSISIPASVISIDIDAFEMCTGLSGIYVSEQNPAYSSDEHGILFDKNMTALLQAPDGISGHYTIPDGVTTIGAAAFETCIKLVSVTIPASVVSIDSSGFCSCNSMTDFIVSSDNPSYSSDSYGNLLDKDKTTLVAVPAGKVGHYTIPDGVTMIGNRALERHFGITDVSIPDSVRTIGDFAFADCHGLGDVTIPDSVNTIGASAFSSCYNLTCVSIPDSVTTIGRYAFCDCHSLKDVTIPNCLTEICDGTFAGCNSLSIVTIPDSIKTIGAYAFSNCGNLRDVTIGNNVTEICSGAFGWCVSLTDVTFTGDAPDISSNSFSDITATAYYPANNSTWDEDVMQNYEGNITWVAYDPEMDDEEEPDNTIEYHNTLEELTEVDYLAFAQVAYEDFKASETVQQCLTRLDNKWEDVWGESGITYAELCEGIAQWKVCHIRENTGTGFYAVAFKNNSGEAVLAYRGSKPINSALDLIETEDAFADWIMNDFPLILFNDETVYGQFDDAIQAYEGTAKIESIQEIEVTGHSLGGLWGDVVSGYSGCDGVTFNAISALDIMYASHPDDLGKNFHGVDAWNFADHANMYDIMAGMTEAASSALAFGTKLKPYVKHYSNYEKDNIFGSHSLTSIVCRDGDGLSLSNSPGSWKGTTGISNYLSFTDKAIDMGTSGNNRFDKGLSAAVHRTSFGGDGNDNIITSTRADTLIGGAGADVLDGGWGNDIYYYFKGDGYDTIMDVGGQDKLYLEGFDDSDLIEVYEDDESDYISISCNGNTIINIYKKNREYSVFATDSFRVYINGGRENNISEYFSKFLYGSRLLVHCPVSINILDSEGNIVYTVADGVAGTYYTDYGNFYVFQEDNGGYGKVLDLREGYTARIIGEATGSMDVIYQEIVNGELSDPKQVTDVPVSDSASATIQQMSDGTLVLIVDSNNDGIGDEEITFTGDQPETVLGDLDGDGVVSDSDVEYLLWYTLFPDLYPITTNADYDKDGVVSDTDVEYLLWYTLFPDLYPLG